MSSALLYNIKWGCARNQISDITDFTGERVLKIEYVVVDIEDVSRVGHDTAIIDGRVLAGNDSNCAQCVMCGRKGYNIKIRVRDGSARGGDLPLRGEWMLCPACCNNSRCVYYDGTVYAHTNQKVIAGKSIIETFPADSTITPVYSAPGAQNVYAVESSMTGHRLHAFAGERPDVLRVPHNVCASPFMRDDNTLCTWVGSDSFLIWDTRMVDARVLTTEDLHMQRMSSAFETDHIFISLSQIRGDYMVKSTYDIRNMALAIATVPTYATTVV